MTIGNSVTSIGDMAFRDCPSLTMVTIGNSVTSIGESAFYYCYSLKSVTIPNSVTKIGEYAFNGCSSLTSFVVDSENSYYCSEDNVLFNKDKSELLFCVESKRGDYTIPNSVTNIGSNAFFGCSGLTSVTIPNSVTSIGNSAFQYCSNLTSVTIPNSVTEIGEYAFNRCLGLTSVTIPNSVTSIAERTFYECSGLKKISLGSGLKELGSQSFASCRNLEEVTCYAVDVPQTDKDAFMGSYIEYTTLNVPKSSLQEYKVAYPWNTFFAINPIDMPVVEDEGKCGDNLVWTLFDDGRLLIEGSAEMMDMNYDSQPWNPYLFEIKSVEIGNSVTSIGVSAFRGCTGLTSVTIGNSVASIGEAAFYDCNSLTSFVVDSENRYYCSEDNVLFNKDKSKLLFCVTTKVGDYVIPNSVTKIADHAFYGCTVLSSVTIPNSVTSIGYSAFRYCNSLSSVSIPDGVTSVGAWAFSCCEALTSIRLSYSLDSLSIRMFDGCVSLESVTIPGNIKKIGNHAFNGCPLASVDLPSNIQEIGFGSFYGCENLTSIDIPQSVTFIDEYAFEACYALTDVTVHWTDLTQDLAQWNVFYDCDLSNATLHVPASAIDAYRNIEPWSNFGNIVPLADEEVDVPSIQSNARNIRVSSSARTITISGLNEDELVEFYTADSKYLGSANACNGNAIFQAPSSAMVIAKFADRSIKIKVK